MNRLPPTRVPGLAGVKVRLASSCRARIVSTNTLTRSSVRAVAASAIADCVTRFLMEERDFTARQAREIRDRWLFVTLGEA